MSKKAWKRPICLSTYYRGLVEKGVCGRLLLQFETLDERSRHLIEKALLRYCELDSLAMVMIVEAWKDAIPYSKR